MRAAERTLNGLLLGTVVLVVMAVAVAGCRKEDAADGVVPTGEVVVAISGSELKPDGSLTDAGLDKIRSKSDASKLVVSFFRTPVSDAGLKQLASFPNITRVQASGSKITDRGVQEFKKKLPQADVIK
jgi:hypothetical protein